MSRANRLSKRLGHKMHFGRQLSAFSVAVMAFTLETHDSGLAVTMPPSAPHTVCSDCQTNAPSNPPPVLEKHVIGPRFVTVDDTPGAPPFSSNPPPQDNWYGPQIYAGSGADGGSNGWLRMAGGPGLFSGPSGGPSGLGGGTPGSGGSGNNDGGGKTTGGGNGSSNGGTGGGGIGGGGNGGGGSNGNNPPPANNNGGGGNGGTGGGGAGSGDNGGSGSNGNNPPPGNNNGGGGNGGGTGQPPIVIPDPPPGGYPPPDGPPPIVVPPGGSSNTPGTTDVPEPASLLIALAGLAGLTGVRRRKPSR
jgi:hypothetical protein